MTKEQIIKELVKIESNLIVFSMSDILAKERIKALIKKIKKCQLEPK